MIAFSRIVYVPTKMAITDLPAHLFDHIFSNIEETQTREVTRWCLSVCNKELYLTLPVALNTSFLYAHQVQAAELSQDCACMLLGMNRIVTQIAAWSEKAARHGWEGFLFAMYDKGDRYRSASRSIFVLEILMEKRRLDIISVLFPSGFDDDLLRRDTFEKAVRYGFMDLVVWIHDVHPRETFSWAINIAAEFGHLDIVKYLYENKLCEEKSWALDFAAMNGHYDTVVYLHENDIGYATHQAMDTAARFGHYKVLKYLHHHRKEGCTIEAMDQAAICGHEGIVRFLNENRTEGYTVTALQGAEANGYPAIADYLRHHGKHCIGDDAYNEDTYAF